MPSHANSFGAFLGALHGRGADEAPRALSGRVPRLLGTLAISGPQPVETVMARSEMGFTEFAEALRLLRELGLVTLEGAPGHEEVELTQQGAQLLETLR
jgi:hypothetical protein